MDISRPEARLEGLFSGVVEASVPLRMSGPNICSAFPSDESSSQYDDSFGSVYDIIACNRFYNRLLWGYWPAGFLRLAREALTSGDSGWVLDAGCGSLAFTAKAYAQYFDRPVVLLDSSLKLLRMAEARLIRLCGAVPENIFLLHADALSMPFRDGAFTSIIAQNLLHAVDDAGRLLEEFGRVLAPGGGISLTTLIESGRFSDAYLRMLAGKGLLERRDLNDIMEIIEDAGMKAELRTEGNMAYASCSQE